MSALHLFVLIYHVAFGSKHVPRAACVVLLVLGICRAACADDPRLSYLFPAGAERGQTLDVEAGGEFAQWPLEVWTNDDDLQASAQDEKGRLHVQLASHTAAGVYWLRLYNPSGASELRPFLVSAVAEGLEIEPNDTLEQAQEVGDAVVVNGQLSQRGEVDTFAVQLDAGQTLVVAVEANRLLGSPMDAVVQVCDAHGFVLEQNDDAGGLDPLAVHRAQHSGRFIVRLFAFPQTPTSRIEFAGDPSYVYRMTFAKDGYIDHALPLTVRRSETTKVRLYGWGIPPEERCLEVPAAGDSEHTSIFRQGVAGWLQVPTTSSGLVVDVRDQVPEGQGNGKRGLDRLGKKLPADAENDLLASCAESPPSLALPAVISGRIESDGSEDAFRFPATRGVKYTVAVQSRSLGFPLDAVLRIRDSKGKQLEQVDDVRGEGEVRDPQLVWAAPADGEYFVSVNDLHSRGGFRFVYRLSLAEAKPDFRLTLESDRFAVVPGESMEIPVKVQRLHGARAEIVVTALDLPDGVTCEGATSSVGAESADSVKLKLSANVGASRGTFRVAGHMSDSASGNGPARQWATFPVQGSAVRQRDAWLTILSTLDSSTDCD